MSFTPVSFSLERTTKSVPTISRMPENNVNPRNPFPFLEVMTPAIGLPIRTPVAETAYKLPVRIPSFRISGEIFAIKAGMMEKMQPEAKPYNIVNTMIKAFVCPEAMTALGNQKAKLVIAPKPVSSIIMLKTPKMSPKYAGMTRPKVEAALRIETK